MCIRDSIYILLLSTKVECAAQCLLTTSCYAFTYDGNSCQLLDPTYFYRDKTGSSTTSIYIGDSAWNMRGKYKIISKMYLQKRITLGKT